MVQSRRSKPRRRTNSGNLLNQIANQFSKALTASLFLASLAFAYYLQTNPSVLTNFANKLQGNTLTKPFGTYINSHPNQTIGAIEVLGASFSAPLSYQVPLAIGGLVYAFEIAKASTTFWEYFGFSLTLLLFSRANSTRIRLILGIVVITLIAYDVLSIPTTASN